MHENYQDMFHMVHSRMLLAINSCHMDKYYTKFHGKNHQGTSEQFTTINNI